MCDFIDLRSQPIFMFYMPDVRVLLAVTIFFSINTPRDPTFFGFVDYLCIVSVSHVHRSGSSLFEHEKGIGKA
jgi:hypothetical protein